MALNKDILGTDLYNRANAYNEVNITDIEAARLAFWKNMAEGIIEHFKTNGVLTVPGTGLIAPTSGGPVTGQSITGNLS
jgi:hypothetical protein